MRAFPSPLEGGSPQRAILWVYRRLKQWRLARLAAWWQRRTYRLDPLILAVSPCSPLDRREAGTTWPVDSWTGLADTQTRPADSWTGLTGAAPASGQFIYHL
ncbi:MAG: hypothetical protein KKB13_17040 [Chloroflexi bacterium]|nr:hypothetical protein [Chloroflexota bacterium]